MLPKYVAQFVHEIAVLEGFTPNKYDIQHNEQPPSLLECDAHAHNNDETTVQRISVNGIDGDYRSLHLLCRTHTSQTLFERELAAYGQILPALQLASASALTSPSTFVRVSKFYGVINKFPVEPTEKSFIIQDLSEGRHIDTSAGRSVDLTSARLALVELSKLHAASFAMRQRRPDEFAQLCQHRIVDAELLRRCVDERFRDEWLDFYRRAIGTLGDDETGLQEEMEEIRNSFELRLQKSLRLPASDHANAAFGVLGHGDFWSANVAIVDGGVPYLTHWQSLQYTLPCIDVLHFVFGSLASDVRREHFWELMRTYHESLVERIREHGVNEEAARTAYPFEKFAEHLNAFADYGLVVTPILFGRATHARANGLDEETYTKRMGDVVRDFVVLEFEVGSVWERNE